jgi:hypothetical protein
MHGRGPLQEVSRAGSSDAGQPHCDLLPIHRGDVCICIVQHRLRGSLRTGEGCLAREVVGSQHFWHR